MILGTLAPPLLHDDEVMDSIDLVIATHWVYPAKVPVLVKEDENCIAKEMQEHLDEGKNS